MDLIDALHLRAFWKAIRNRSISRHRNSYWYYLGGLSLFFLLIQIVTGILLVCYYRPTPGAANQSIRMMMERVPYGEVIRSIHAWSASALIALVALHMLSMFFMKAYTSPRKLLWITGLALSLLLLAFGFTGYLLPWDPTAYFATGIGVALPREIPLIGNLVGAWLRGSRGITGATLSRMYALHVAILPLLAVVLVLVHVTVTTLLGRAPTTAKITGETRFFPDYLLVESIVWLIGLALLLTVAVLFPWPLAGAYDLAKPTEPPAGLHPAWYFMFLYQTLRYLPNWATVWLYLIVLIVWFCVPWLESRFTIWKRLLTGVGIILITGFALLTTLAYISVAKEKAAVPAEHVVPALDTAAY